MNIPKSMTLPATALIPSLSMAAGTNLIDFNPRTQNILKGITTGMLITASILLLPEGTSTPKKGMMMITGFIASLAIINLSTQVLKHSKASAITSLYFDALSDGVMLGALLDELKTFKKIRPLLLPMSIEMALTGSNTVKILEEENVKNPKIQVTLAAAILGLSIFFGKKLGKKLNKEFVIGFGSASMLWLALNEFMPSLSKFPTLINNLSIYVGIIASLFLE